MFSFVIRVPRQCEAVWNKLITKLPKNKVLSLPTPKKTAEGITRAKLLCKTNSSPGVQGSSYQPLQEPWQEHWSWCEIASLLFQGQLGRSSGSATASLTHGTWRHQAQIWHIPLCCYPGWAQLSLATQELGPCKTWLTQNSRALSGPSKIRHIPIPICLSLRTKV